MRTFALALLIAFLGTPGRTQPLQISAMFGFLNEYELSAVVAPDASGAENRLTGPVTIRHVGLCTHDGPNESRSEITVQITDTRSQIGVAFAFAGQQCAYKGKASRENVGELICSGNAIPFSIWFGK